MATYVLVHGSAHGGWCYQAVARLLRAQGHDVYTPTLTGLGERSHLLFPGTGPLPTHGLTDPDQIAWASPRLTPHPWKTYLQPLRLGNESEVWAIPQTHIVASRPLAEHHPERLAAARDAGRVHFIDTGHDVMMTEPDAVAEILLGVAG